MPSTRKLYRQGNSIVVALPSHILDHAHLHTGDTVIIRPFLSTSIALTKYIPPDHSLEGSSQKLKPDTPPGGEKPPNGRP